MDEAQRESMAEPLPLGGLDRAEDRADEPHDPQDHAEDHADPDDEQEAAGDPREEDRQIEVERFQRLIGDERRISPAG